MTLQLLGATSTERRKSWYYFGKSWELGVRSWERRDRTLVMVTLLVPLSTSLIYGPFYRIETDRDVATLIERHHLKFQASYDDLDFLVFAILPLPQTSRVGLSPYGAGFRQHSSTQPTVEIGFGTIFDRYS